MFFGVYVVCWSVGRIRAASQIIRSPSRKQGPFKKSTDIHWIRMNVSEFSLLVFSLPSPTFSSAFVLFFALVYLFGHVFSRDAWFRILFSFLTYGLEWEVKWNYSLFHQQFPSQWYFYLLEHPLLTTPKTRLVQAEAVSCDYHNVNIFLPHSYMSSIDNNDTNTVNGKAKWKLYFFLLVICMWIVNSLIHFHFILASSHFLFQIVTIQH